MNTEYVSPGKPRVSGAIYRAAAGSTVPTDAVTPLAETFAELGYVSEDGVTNSNTAEKTDIYSWGGTPVMKTTDRKPDDWTYTLLEALNPEVLKTVYGDSNVVVSDDGKSISVMATADDTGEVVYVIDMALSNNSLKRIVIPKGVLGSVAEIVYRDNQPIGYKITISALYDASGRSHYEYIQRGSSDAATASLVGNDEGETEVEA